MKQILPLLFLSALVFSSTSFAEDSPPPQNKPSLVDIAQFSKLTLEASQLRSQRLVKWEKFQEIASRPGTLILDTRSKKAFEQVHLQGAVHLNFSDFTEEKLAQVIPAKTTTILIYCNNNFSARPEVEARFAALADKSPGLALNIPTFINLYGYGYTNVYELAELLDVNDPRVDLEGTVVTKQP